jgi:hypothetical protein
MQSRDLLDFLPLWGLFLFTFLLVLLSIEGGFRLGRYRSSRADPEKEESVGTLVGATLGLLAFLMAFTFGMAASRYDTRRHVLLDEVNAIGTAYLRAELLAEPHRTEVRALLRQYVDARVESAYPGHLEQMVHRSEELQDRLWSHAVAAGRKAPNSIVVGLFIQALNEVIDLHTKRIQAGVRSRVPPSIWMVLYVITVLGMAEMGYHAGLTGARSMTIPALALVFAAVMMLIADLDRPGEGLIQVSQQAMIDLQKSMAEHAP